MLGPHRGARAERGAMGLAAHGAMAIDHIGQRAVDGVGHPAAQAGTVEHDRSLGKTDIPNIPVARRSGAVSDGVMDGTGRRSRSRRWCRPACKHARPRQPAGLVDDQVFGADRPAVQPAFEDFAGAGGVAGLRRQRAAEMCGVMPWCGMLRQGWSRGAGCGNHTSPA